MNKPTPEKMGAQAAFAILRSLDSRKAPVGEDTLENYDAERARAIALFTDVADSPFTKGFLAAIGEYVDSNLSSGVPNLGAWKPTLLLTKAQAAKWRRELEKDYASDH